MPLPICLPQRPGADALYERQRQTCQVVAGLELTFVPLLLLAGLAEAATRLPDGRVSLVLAVLAALWGLARAPGLLRDAWRLRRCPACQGRVGLTAERCDGCGQSFGPRPVAAGAGSPWSPPPFLARPLPEVRARATQLRWRLLLARGLMLAGLGAAFGASVGGRIWVAVAGGVVFFAAEPFRFLSQRCPACDHLLSTGNDAQKHGHCPSCTWPLPGGEAQAAPPEGPSA